MTSKSTFPLLIFVLVAYVLAGSFDMGSELDEEKDYCDRLQNRVHTDYNHIKDTCAARYWNSKTNF